LVEAGPNGWNCTNDALLCNNFAITAIYVITANWPQRHLGQFHLAVAKVAVLEIRDTNS
jgi:hypothetical protein